MKDSFFPMKKPILIISILGVLVLFAGTAVGAYVLSAHSTPVSAAASTTTAAAVTTATSTPSPSEQSAPTASTTTPGSTDLLSNYHLGLNFFIFKGGTGKAATMNSTRSLAPDTTATDLASLHAEVVRQLTNADALWDTVEPREGAWNWTSTDSALQALSATSEPIVDLFAMQYASPNAPWKTTGTFEKTMTPEAETYLRAVVGRYKDIVKYWEIGNEMDHWRAADPGVTAPKNLSADSKLPQLKPTDGYSPEDQGKFFAAAAAIVREIDPDAVMVMPGMASVDSFQTGTWLPGFVKGAGTDGFDVVNYHDYQSWDGMQSRFNALHTAMQTLGISGKPIWLTETGSTTDATLAQRTNYPNSTTTQAADVLRRLLTALSNGVNVAIWHTYFSSPSLNGTNAWRGYGLRDENGTQYPSYSAYQALGESFPATSVQNISTTSGMYVIKITPVSGPVAYAVWGSGTWTVPTGLTSQYTISSTAVAKTAAPAAGSSVTLSVIPQLFR